MILVDKRKENDVNMAAAVLAKAFPETGKTGSFVAAARRLSVT